MQLEIDEAEKKQEKKLAKTNAQNDAKKKELDKAVQREENLMAMLAAKNKEEQDRLKKE